jgi:hypothetical protein
MGGITMPKVKEIIKELSRYDQDEELLIIYWDKDLCREWIKDWLEHEQEENNLSDEQVEAMFKDAWASASDDSYDTDDVGNTITDNLQTHIGESIHELQKQQTEIIDTELWEE